MDVMGVEADIWGQWIHNFLLVCTICAKALYLTVALSPNTYKRVKLILQSHFVSEQPQVWQLNVTVFYWVKLTLFSKKIMIKLSPEDYIWTVVSGEKIRKSFTT